MKTPDLLRLIYDLEVACDEPAPDVEQIDALLNTIADELGPKLDALRHVYQSLLAKAGVHAAEARAQQRKRGALEAGAERVKAMVEALVVAAGPVETTHAKYAMRRASQPRLVAPDDVEAWRPHGWTTRPPVKDAASAKAWMLATKEEEWPDGFALEWTEYVPGLSARKEKKA